MTAHWNLDHLLGYLRTWSSTERFIAAKGADPLEQINDDLRSAWGESEQPRTVTWPVIMRIGRKQGARLDSPPVTKDSCRAKTLE